MKLSLVAKIQKTLRLPLREWLISFFRKTNIDVVKAYIYLKRLSFTADPGLQKVREWFSQLNIDLYTEKLIKIIKSAINSTGGVAYLDQEEIEDMLEEAVKNYGWLKQSDNT